MNAKQKIGQAIEKAVGDYRQAVANAKQFPNVDFYRGMMYRAVGKLDLLAELDPKNPAFVATEWSGF